MLSEKRAVLFGAAKSYAAEPNDETGRGLCVAASVYAEARLSAASGGTAAKAAEARDTGPVIPFGRSKGKSLSQASKPDLEWVLGAVEKSISDPAKARFIEANESLRDALRAELSRR